MGKIFTITEGLENMGAMRTGGQGSVYKGKRIGEIITAVKLLPTPIHTEDDNDKNFRDFKNEVAKLKKVNEEPNPHVVKILNSGITESGSFPFIEMEFIEGQDLEELLKSPHDPVFTIREAIKVADQLSCALAHCHKVGVRHGDIKSNNIKFNTHSGNYILLDFGLAIMSDEQRRSSLRHAGAIEFMAPEQNEGKMLFQTDIYSFGVILYELLAGTVPFPLLDNGETSRNNVMVSHMETPVPDLLTLRKEHLPQSWAQVKKDNEMQVPGWLLAVISKCLEKKPENRYKSGIELNEAIVANNSNAVNSDAKDTESVVLLKSEVNRLNGLLIQYQEADPESSQAAFHRDGYQEPDSSKVVISKPVFYVLLIFLVGFGIFTAYSLINNKSGQSNLANTSTYTDSLSDSKIADSLNQAKIEADQKNKSKAVVKPDSLIKISPDSIAGNQANMDESLPVSNDQSDLKADSSAERPSTTTTQSRSASYPSNRKYVLAVSKAYFYNSPNESSIRKSFLSKSNNPELTSMEEKDGYIYVVFFNSNAQITKGWLRKKDLKRIGG